MILLEPKEEWEALKIGAGTPPIRTKKGWLIIYHGVSADKVYRAGVCSSRFKKSYENSRQNKEPNIRTKGKL